jgi:tetratricopeptide (TPR) repeat protein
MLNAKQQLFRNLTKQRAAFLWHQLLVDTLRRIPLDDQSFSDLLKTWHLDPETNTKTLENIERYQRERGISTAIKMYTEHSFCSSVINKALRTRDIELLYSLRHFIGELCNEIENLGREQKKEKENRKKFHVFRGSRVPEEQFKQLFHNLGGLISVNSFLSTTRDKDVALLFACPDHPTEEDEKIVLFDIRVDPSLKTVIYADIENNSSKPDEREVLFSLNSTFKIEEIAHYISKNTWLVKMVGTNEGSKHIREYRRLQQRQLQYQRPRVAFGNLIFQYFGQIDQAEKYFTMLLKTLPKDHPDLPSIYTQLGSIYRLTARADAALAKYRVAYEIRQQNLTPGHPDIADSLNCLGNWYRDKNELEQALEFYQQSLIIRQKVSSHQNKISEAQTWNSIGVLYLKQGNFNVALKYFNLSLKRYSRLLPSNHPIIATCLSNVGLIYENQARGKSNADRYFNRALKYRLKALQIKEYSLPYDHPDVIKYLQKTVEHYKKRKMNGDAFLLCSPRFQKELVEYGEQTERVARRLMIIGSLFEDERSSNTVEEYHSALTMLEHLSPPADSRTMVRLFDIMRKAYLKRRDYDQALKFALKELEIFQSELSYDHERLGLAQQKVGRVYRAMGKMTEAAEYFNESLLILQSFFDNDHQLVKDILADIASLSPEALAERQARLLAKRRQEEEMQLRGIKLAQAVRDGKLDKPKRKRLCVIL